MRTDGSRPDAVRNRQRLIDTVGELLIAGEDITLASVSEASGVSKATTYRNFESASDAIEAYISEFLSDFEDAVSTEGNVTASLDEVTQAWGELVAMRSTALVHVRSTEGFLARVHRGEPIICRVDRVVRSALKNESGFDNATDADLDYGVFLWNLLLDPREMLDLAEAFDLSVQAATDKLSATYRAALQV